MNEKLKEEYQLRFSSNDIYRNNVWEIITKNFFQAQVGKDKIILDLGCGWGEFINNIQGSNKYGMDLNPESTTKLNQDVHFLHQDCSKTWDLPDESLDVVFTSNFFEHLLTKEALSNTISQAFRCLKKGGIIICLGPNINYVGNHYWDFFDHHISLSDKSLCEGLRLEGFSIQNSIDRFMPYTMSEGKPPPLFLIKYYLKIPFAWQFFGKQFLITAKK